MREGCLPETEGSGRMRRFTCTADCRDANGCHGAITCRECGKVYCPKDEGYSELCGDCREREGDKE